MLSLLSLVVAAAAPPVSSGPELESEAVVVPAPIAEVTVYSDRARVRRVARPKLGGAPAALRLPDLPGATINDSVRVESDTAKVLRVEVQPVERERVSIEEVDALLAELEGLDDERQKVRAQEAALRAELALLDDVRPQVAPPDKRPAGSALVLAPEAWKPMVELFSSRRQADHAALRELGVRSRDLERKRQGLVAEISERNLGGMSNRRLQVIAIVTGDHPGEAELRLEYTVPGASWRPVYELHFDATRSEVTLDSAGLVRQATGEAWSDVTLLASTAIPGQGIALPELLTWTLGEKGELVPRARAARAAVPVAAKPPPSGGVRWEDARRDARAQARGERLAELNELLAGDGAAEMPQGSALLPIAQSADRGGQAASMGSRMVAKKQRPRAPGRAVPPPAPAPPPQPVMAVSEEMAPASIASSDSFEGVSISFSGLRSSEKAPTLKPLALRDAQGWVGPRLSDPTLPAVLAGGFDYIYQAPARASVPSSGEALRVPLEARTYPVRLFYEATPALATTAYLRAEVKNRESQPILAGNVSIFSGGDFLAETTLKTTGPGGTLELPLGADEDLRITYQVVPSSRVEGVISKEDVTEYAVRIEVGNYKKHDVRVRVRDQIPKVSVDKLVMELLKTSPTTAFGPDANGVLGWEVDVPAGKTTTITMTYLLRRPKDWRIYQQ